MTIQGSAEFLDDVTGRHRVRLVRRWRDGPLALVGMANPSKAGGEESDPTIHSLDRLLMPLCAGYTAINWSTKILTDAREHAAWWAALSLAEKGRMNALALLQAHDLARDAALRIVAWGNLVPIYHPHTKAFLDTMSGHGAFDLYCFGTTNDGAPKHPLARGKSRIPNGFQPVIYRAAKAAA